MTRALDWGFFSREHHWSHLSRSGMGSMATSALSFGSQENQTALGVSLVGMQHEASMPPLFIECNAALHLTHAPSQHC